MGSTRSSAVYVVVRKIWFSAIKKNIWILASHIPEVFYQEADEESRKIDMRSEWKLSIEAFHFIKDHLDISPSIDLFVTNVNTQFSSFRPDPDASHIDVFSIGFHFMLFFHRCVQTIVSDETCRILVVPNWTNQV